jgi:protocatechuate 3,4-dioxygenase alpha subunit
MTLPTTASQTIGPFLHLGLAWLVTDNLVGAGVTGERITVEGRIVDGDGKPVRRDRRDLAGQCARSLCASGRRAGQAARSRFQGIRSGSHDDDGGFRFATIKPGACLRWAAALQAPHLNVTIFMRGLLKHLFTRIYFPGDPANAEDPALQRVPAARRGTLVATPIAGRTGALAWNVVLQGKDETVFFDY